MSKINLPNSNFSVSGMKNDGTVLWNLPIRSDFDKDGIYRMIYEIQNLKGENKYSTNVDLTFNGEDILRSLIKTYDVFRGNYNGPQKDNFLFFRHFCKNGMMVYSYNKIKGHTLSVRKYLRSLSPILTTKVQKELLRDKGWLMDLVRSYLYLKIEKGFNSVKIKDVESMTDEEINQKRKGWEGFNWEEETNLKLMFSSEEEYWKQLKNGLISWEGFDSDLSNVETFRQYKPLSEMGVNL